MVFFKSFDGGFFVLTFIQNGTVQMKTYNNRMRNFRKLFSLSWWTFKQDFYFAWLSLKVIKLFSEMNVISETKVKLNLEINC